MASIGIGIGIEDPILQVLVLVLVLTLGSSEVLVLVSEKWYCLSLLASAFRDMIMKRRHMKLLAML